MMNRHKSYRKRMARLCLAAGLLFLAACQADDLTMPAAQQAGNVTFEVNLPLSGTVVSQARTSAMKRENQIQALDVLAFAADGSFRHYYPAGELYSIDGGGKWLYRLPLDPAEAQGLRFVFFANLHDEVARAVEEGRVGRKDDLYREIEFENIDWTAHPSAPFPMWGETPDGYDATSAAQGLNRVSLLRAVSTVDVVLNGNATEAFGVDGFKLACVKVCDVPSKGCAAPAPGHFEWTERQTGGQTLNEYTVKEATVAADTGLTSLQTDGTTPTNALRGKIIVPESDAEGAWNTTFLIGGYYGGSDRISWYRLNFADLLRNRHYILNITQVARAGYDTPEEAYAHEPENIHATLELRPEAEGLAHVVYDAGNYLATDKTELHMAAGKSDGLQILTSASGGWTLAGMPEWLEASATQGAQGVRAAVSLSLKDGYASEDLQAATLRLRAGQLEMAVTVRPGGGSVIEYETPYVCEVWQAADFGLADGEFLPNGGMAFLGTRYAVVADNHADSPAIIVYDRERKEVAARLSEWTFNGQTLSFSGTADRPDCIDNVAVDETDGRLYVSRRQSCVDIFDLSDPARPVYVTRIGQWGEAAAYTRNRLSGSGAVLPARDYLLVRDDMSLDTYLYKDLTSGNYQEISCVTRDNQKMTHSGHQPAQWAVDPVDGGIYLTDYNGSFQGIHRIDPSRADSYVQAGQYWKQQDLRDRSLPLAYRPTGLLITERKVYVTRQDGSLDIFSRTALAGTQAPKSTRRILPEKAERSVSLHTVNGRPGKLQGLYQDPLDAESFWSMDLTNRTLVRLNLYRSSIEVQP